MKLVIVLHFIGFILQQYVGNSDILRLPSSRSFHRIETGGEWDKLTLAKK